MQKWKLTMAGVAIAASASFAFAGGPEMPTSSASFFLGIGGAYDYAQFYAEQRTTTATSSDVRENIFGLSPIGQLGFDYYGTSGYFFGVKGLFNYIDKGGLSAATNVPVFVTFNSMVAAMIEGGYRYGNNAIYLEGGYSALFLKQEIREIDVQNTILAQEKSSTSGGIIGIGYRCFVWDHLFLDLTYSYALYKGLNQISGLGLGEQITGLVTAHTKRPRVQDISFTINYLFNV